MNMVLSEVEEQISLLEIDEASNQQKIKVRCMSLCVTRLHG